MRFDISKLLAPQSLKPRTSGPRDDFGYAPTEHIAAPTTPTTPEPSMHPNDTQGKVLAALHTKSPMNREELAAAAGLETGPLSNALYNLKKKSLITAYRDEYSLAAGPTPKPAAKATTKKPDKIPCGPKAPTFAARLADANTEAPASTINRVARAFVSLQTQLDEFPRATATADGGCLLLDGNLLVAALSKEQRALVAALES